MGTDFGGFEGGAVSVIDTATNQVIKNISVGGAPRSLTASADGTRIYVANYVHVAVIDTATNEVVETITVPEQRQGVGGVNYVTDVAVSPNANGSVIYALRVYHDSAGSYG